MSLVSLYLLLGWIMYMPGQQHSISTTSIALFMGYILLYRVFYLVAYTVKPNLLLETGTNNFDLHQIYLKSHSMMLINHPILYFHN